MMKNYIRVGKALLRRSFSRGSLVFVNGVQLERPPEKDSRTSRYTTDTTYQGVPIRVTTYNADFGHVLDGKPDNSALYLMGELYRSDDPRTYEIRLERFGAALPTPSSLAA